MTSDKAAVTRTAAIAIGAGSFVAGAAIAAVIALAVTGADDDSTAKSISSSTSTLPVQLSFVQPTRTTEEVPAAGGIGQPVQNGGITLTVDSVTEQTELDRGRDGIQSPQPGAKFVRIDTTIDNTGRVSLDLTCSYPIANKVWDSQKREFDSVESLYEIPGNPECNDGLQPGFSSKMTYVYEVPADAIIEFFGFADSDVDYGANTSFVSLSP